MGTIHIKHLKQIKSLYNEGYSLREIGEKLGYSIHAVFYFFRKQEIKRRSARETNSFIYQRKPTSFKVKESLSPEEEILKTAGIMLYWAEGSKYKGESKIDFANSDPKMISLFMVFLRNICGVEETKLRVYTYCFVNQDINELLSFWSNLTNIPKEQFTKPYVRQEFKESKKDKMKYGLIHIRYNDKKLFLLIMDWIKQFTEKY
jgi:hypothetical protein